MTKRYHPVTKVASPLGVSGHSLYQWIKLYSVPPAERAVAANQQSEMRRLKGELKRVTEERDILKKAAVYFARLSGEIRIHSRTPKRLIDAAIVESARGTRVVSMLAAQSRVGTRDR